MAKDAMKKTKKGRRKIDPCGDKLKRRILLTVMLEDFIYLVARSQHGDDSWAIVVGASIIVVVVVILSYKCQDREL
jgi:hypothetical protein